MPVENHAHRHLSRCLERPSLPAPVSPWRPTMAGEQVDSVVAAARQPLPPMADAAVTQQAFVHGVWRALSGGMDAVLGCMRAAVARLSLWTHQLLQALGLIKAVAPPTSKPAPVDDGTLFMSENGTLLSPYLEDDRVLQANRQAYAAAVRVGKPLARVQELQAVASLFGVQVRLLDVPDPHDSENAWRELERFELSGPCRGYVDLYCTEESPWQVLFDGPLKGAALASPPRPPGADAAKVTPPAHQELLRVLHKRPIAPAHGGAPYARVRPTPDEQVLPLAQSPLRGVSFNDAFYCAIADASASRYHRAVLDGVLRGTSINTLRQRPEVLGAFGIAPQEALSKSELKRRLVQQLVLQMRQEVAERLLSPRHRPVLDGMIQFALRHARLVTPA